MQILGGCIQNATVQHLQLKMPVIVLKILWEGGEEEREKGTNVITFPRCLQTFIATFRQQTWGKSMGEI